MLFWEYINNNNNTGSLVGVGAGGSVLGGGGAKSFSHQTQLFVVKLSCVEVQLGLWQLQGQNELIYQMNMNIVL